MSARATIPIAPDTAQESREIVRTRRFLVRDLRDLVEVVKSLQRERCVGQIQINLTTGGSLQSAHFEERSRIPS